VFHLGDGTSVRYSDARRFGYMDLIPNKGLHSHALFKGLGVEPLGPDFTPEWLASRLKGKATSIKAALVDQRLIAGIGNIYACEALFRAGIDPRTRCGRVSLPRCERLLHALREVLSEAVALGGSTLRDFRDSHGTSGEFQTNARVYGREGQPCLTCRTMVRRVVQGQRSSFFCPSCQRR